MDQRLRWANLEREKPIGQFDLRSQSIVLKHTVGWPKQQKPCLPSPSFCCQSFHTLGTRGSKKLFNGIIYKQTLCSSIISYSSLNLGNVTGQCQMSSKRGDNWHWLGTFDIAQGHLILIEQCRLSSESDWGQMALPRQYQMFSWYQKNKMSISMSKDINKPKDISKAMSNVPP